MTLVIVGLLGVLVLCYRQVIAAFPDGGVAYTVAKTHLGRRAGLVTVVNLRGIAMSARAFAVRFKLGEHSTI
ncbi:MAG TPA: hypothetical protein VGM75_04265 [Pseudonocardiaceae bacterium]